MSTQTTISPSTLGDEKPDNPFTTAPPSLRPSRSLAQIQNKLRQTRSPTRRQISDDIFADLTPEGIRDLFVNADTEHEASIEAAGPELRELGKRAAVASGYIHEWYNEITTWPWSEKVNGFLPPADEDSTDYFGSLTKSQLLSYKERLHEIRDGLDYLNVREIHQRVREFNCMTNGNNSPTSPSAPPNRRFSSASTYAPKIINKFEILITHTTVEALPKLGQLESALLDWKNRVSILEQIPATLASLEAAELALKEAFAGANYDREHYNTTKAELDRLCKDGSQLIDQMLDFVGRGDDRLPSEWIERIDAIEEAFQIWCDTFDAKVQANEKIERDLREEQIRQQEKDAAALHATAISSDDDAKSIKQPAESPLEQSEATNTNSVEDPVEQAEAATRGWGENTIILSPDAVLASVMTPPSPSREPEPMVVDSDSDDAENGDTEIDTNQQSEPSDSEEETVPIEEESSLIRGLAQLSLTELEQSVSSVKPGNTELIITPVTETAHPLVFVTDAAKEPTKSIDALAQVNHKERTLGKAFSDRMDYGNVSPGMDVDEPPRPVSSDTLVSFSSSTDNDSERGQSFGAAFSSKFSFRSPQSPGLKGLKSPSRIPRAAAAKVVDSQLYRHVSGIVSALPGATLRGSATSKSSEVSPPKTPGTRASAARPNLKRQTSRPTLSTAPRPSPFSRPPSPSFTRASPSTWRRGSMPGLGIPGTPGREEPPMTASPIVISTGLDITLVPLESNHNNYRHDNTNGYIHISRGDKRDPLKLYVTLAGSGSNVVQVRVGGGYQELSKFLTEFQAHHGTSVKLGEVEDFVIMPLDRNTGGIVKGAPTWQSPASRPGTALGGPKILATPTGLGGSLRVGKRGNRRSISGGTAFGGNPRDRTLRIPTSPLPQMMDMLEDSPDGKRIPTTRSTSLHTIPTISQMTKVGPLGPAFAPSPTSQHTHSSTPSRRAEPVSIPSRNILNSVERSSKPHADRSSQLKRESWVQNVYDIVTKSVHSSDSASSKSTETRKEASNSSTSLTTKPPWGSNRKRADTKTRRENEKASPDKIRSTGTTDRPIHSPRTKRNVAIKSRDFPKVVPQKTKLSTETTSQFDRAKRIRRVSSEPKFMYSSRPTSTSHPPSLASEGSVASFESIKEDVKE